jgi:hypothetical protein
VGRFGRVVLPVCGEMQVLAVASMEGWGTFIGVVDEFDE